MSLSAAKSSVTFTLRERYTLNLTLAFPIVNGLLRRRNFGCQGGDRLGAAGPGARARSTERARKGFHVTEMAAEGKLRFFVEADYWTSLLWIFRSE